MIQFDVVGIPVPQGSKKAYVRGKRAIIVDDNKDILAPWREAVKTRAERAVWMAEQKPLDGPLSLRVLFLIARPKSVKRPYPSVKPDLDKYVRAIGDALTDSKVIGDDGQIVELRALKMYHPTPGCRVVVRAVQEENPLVMWQRLNER